MQRHESVDDRGEEEEEQQHRMVDHSHVGAGAEGSVRSTSVPRSLTMRGMRAATLSVDAKALSIASLVIAIIAMVVALYAMYRLYGAASFGGGSVGSVGGAGAAVSGGATIARASDSAFNAVFRT